MNLKNKHKKSLSSLKGFFLLVPYRLDLSNFIDDFQELRILMNSRNWKLIL